MTADNRVETDASLTVENIGGIDETAVRFDPGVTVLAGRNATNRTSLLQSLMAACGSDDVSIKGDADEARVELSIDGETYSRTLTRNGTTVRGDDGGYLDDPTLADLFAFLLESNEARRAVVQRSDLRDVIMRPVDTAAIRAEIERLLSRRRDIDQQLEEAQAEKERLPELEQRRSTLREQIEDTREQLQATEHRLDEMDADIDQTRAEKEELEEKLTALHETRSELESVRYDLDTEQETIQQLRAEQQDLTAKLEDLSSPPDDAVEQVDDRIDSLRSEKQTLDSEVTELQNIIQFNENMLAGDVDAVESLTPEGSVTDELVADDTRICWTCGSEVDRERIEQTLDHLRERSRETLAEINDVDDEIERLKARQSELRDRKRTYEQTEKRLEEVERDLGRHEDTAAQLRQRRDELNERVQSLETAVENLEDDSYTEILELHKEANQYEIELGNLEKQLEDVETEIREVESAIERESDLEAKREEIATALTDQRTKIDQIEQEAIEAFNDHMEDVLTVLEYDNIERIWLERLQSGSGERSETTFDLHIVRRTESGTTYEDTVGNLSESEREVTGLVFALAGYLVHDVHETVPFMLLDSLEAIDAARIARLVDHFETFPDYLVVALLDEDAAALPDEYRRIRDI